MTTTMSFGSVDEMKQRVNSSGSYYFSRGTMSYWGSRVLNGVYGNTYYVQSDLVGPARVYRVMHVVVNGGTLNPQAVSVHKTRGAAVAEAKRLAKGL